LLSEQSHPLPRQLVFYNDFLDLVLVFLMSPLVSYAPFFFFIHQALRSSEQLRSGCAVFRPIPLSSFSLTSSRFDLPSFIFVPPLSLVGPLYLFPYGRLPGDFLFFLEFCSSSTPRTGPPRRPFFLTPSISPVDL